MRSFLFRVSLVTLRKEERRLLPALSERATSLDFNLEQAEQNLRNLPLTRLCLGSA